MFPAIDPTPDSVARIYATTARNLAAARRRLGRPATLTDKVLLGHLDDPEHVEIAPGAGYVALRPDRVVFQDVLAQSAMLQFMQTGHDRVAVPATIHCDHLIRAETSAGPDLARSLAENGEVYDFLMAVAARYGCGFWRPGAGIVHQVVLENYAFPGQLLIGTDSHTPNAGGLGTCAVGVGGADAVEVIAGLPWELLYPTRIAVHLTGALGGWTAPKDVILKVAGILGVAGGTNAIIEYIGPGARTISATGKATIANMGAELGATTSLFPWDARMARYLAATGRQDLADVADRHRDLLVPDAEAEADPERHYDQVVAIDLSTLEPQISGPHSPDRVRPLSALAAEIAEPANGLVDRISAALIGSCTNSSYEDMGRAADIARQAAAHGMVAAVPFLVTPGSRRVGVTIERDGQMAALDSFGGTVLANACGPCIGQWRRDDPAADAPNTIVTSYNRNFPRRNDGKPTTMNLIASPEIVTALALAGRLSFDPARDALTAPDGKPFRLMPPAPAPDVPAEGFATVAGLYVAPPADGRGIAIAIDPASERLQALHPWPAWTGGDPQGLRVLA
ncbi:MAG: aconitase family protein, partial [Alphaproteobacteria bacterium]